MILGKMIAAYRREHKITLRELSKITGIDYTTLSRIENGNNENCKNWPALLRWVFGK